MIRMLFGLFIFIGSTYAADVQNTISKSIRLWEPLSVSQNEATITIVLNERMITSNIFTAVIGSGVCGYTWMNNDNHLVGLKEIVVLNMFSKKGYIFETPQKACKDLGKATSKEYQIVLLGYARQY